MKKIKIEYFLLLLFSIGIFCGGCSFSKERKEILVPTKEEKEEIIENYMFQGFYKDAKKVVSKMTIEEKVGQLFLVRYDKNQTSKWNSYYPGGYILFAKDFENHTTDSFLSEVESLQENSKYPLILAVDEEGGYVTRISRFKSFREERFASPKSYYEQGGYDLLRDTEKEKANLLKSLGINLNLAPVADVSTNPDDFIYNRTFGRNAEETANLIKIMVQVANENSMNSCLKHFPGYGNNIDTHSNIAVDTRNYSNFLENDYLPFQAGVEAGVPCILVSHNIMASIDDTLPSSLSKKVNDEIRNTIGFTGIVITDDLDMGAIANYVETNNAATLAINAGNDMIITSNFETMREEILNSVKTEVIKMDTIDKAVTKIIAWKYYSNLY